ncbi:MAG: hypothetical protein ACKOBZ_02605 [Nitrospira sp.]
MNLVAQRGAQFRQCPITINSDAARARWTQWDRSCPDIVDGTVTGGKNKAEGMAEVEPDESLSEARTGGQG